MMPTGPTRAGRTWRRGAIVAVALAVLAACGQASAGGGPDVAAVRITTSSGVASLRVPVAESEADQARGLRGRTHLAAGDGMAFLFDQPTRAPFWMKGVAVPLSIAFWDGRGRIVAIMDMPPCGRAPCPTFRPDVPYVGALEVTKGWFAGHGVGVGDSVELDR